MSYNDNVRFFYEHACYGYYPLTETPEEGSQRYAEQLAQAEAWGQRSGYWFAIEVDPDPMWGDYVELETTDYDQYLVKLYDQSGELVGSLGSIDLGPDADPDWHPYVRVVKAELLSEIAPPTSWR